MLSIFNVSTGRGNRSNWILVAANNNTEAKEIATNEANQKARKAHFIRQPNSEDRVTRAGRLVCCGFGISGPIKDWD